MGAAGHDGNAVWQVNFEDDDMEDWEAPDDDDGTYDPENE